MSNDAVLAALESALEADPRNGPLWLHYAELLEAAGRTGDAAGALRTASELTDTRSKALPALIRVLRQTDQLAEALIRAETALESIDDPLVRVELGRVHVARGDLEAAQSEFARVREVQPDLLEAEDEVRAPQAAPQPSMPEPDRNPVAAAVEPESTDPDDWVEQFDWGDLRVTLDDVVGLDDVKRQIHLRIIAPFKQPEIYQAFGRDAGGGLLLYGPPGCGKTYIARATAGELGARFVSVSIHEVVDKYWGESEKLIHSLFEDARKNSPTVLFFDEFDALGSKRGSSETQFWKTLVDQLLHEMDGVDGNNRDLLLFAATNIPWSVDPAFRRPGRFDRVLFVTPPDVAGRKALIERHAGRLPGGTRLNAKRLAKATALYTGADIKALCERAAENALEQSLSSGTVHEVTQACFDDAVAKTESTALEWFSTARNHARYSNDGGQYDDLISYLKKIKRW